MLEYGCCIISIYRKQKLNRNDTVQTTTNKTAEDEGLQLNADWRVVNKAPGEE